MTRGFTLTEVLIATAIFAVILVTVYSGFQSGLFGYRDISETINAYQLARQILGRMNTDLRNSFSYKDKNGSSFFSGAPDKISFLTLLDSYRQDKFTRDFSFVSYSMAGNRLMLLARKGKDALNIYSTAKPEEFAEGVEVKFEYGAMPEAGGELVFRDSWGADNEKQVKSRPQAVKVNLKIKGKAEHAFIRTIYLL